MSDHTNERPYNAVRRQDRAIYDEGWIKSFLHRAAFGVLATVYDGQPFAHSNIFVYDEGANAIYFHNARQGRTPTNLQEPAKVCLTVAEMGRLLPADTALEFSVEYSGVVVFGQACLVEDPEEAEHGLQILLDKYFPHLRPGEHYRTIQPEELRRTAVFRIDIESWSGKQKKAEEDFPGAFRYGEMG